MPKPDVQMWSSIARRLLLFRKNSPPTECRCSEASHSRTRIQTHYLISSILPKVRQGKSQQHAVSAFGTDGGSDRCVMLHSQSPVSKIRNISLSTEVLKPPRVSESEKQCSSFWIAVMYVDRDSDKLLGLTPEITGSQREPC
jgi:hypothetical protein